jgi:hypothetical protein
VGPPRIGVVAFAVLFAACSSFVADSGGTPTPPGDAGPGASADGGTRDAIATEGGTIEPPGTDFCFGAAFCDDFERLKDPKGPWDSLLEPVEDDRADMIADGAHEGQNALRFTISATIESHHATLKKTLSRGGKTKATYRFAYRPPNSFGASGHTDLGYLAVPNGAGSNPVQAALLATNTGLYLYALDKTSSAGFNTDPSAHMLGQWNEAVIHVDFKAHTASFEINGQPGAGLELTYDEPLPDSLEVWLGPDYGSQQGAFIMDVDAARLDLE